MSMTFITRFKHKRVFIDTSAWIALMLQGEPDHKTISQYVTQELKLKSKFFTNDYVLDETFTRLLKMQGIGTAKKFRHLLKKIETQQQILIFWTDEISFKQIWPGFEKFSEHKLSFTDASIYALVKNFKINEVLTLDQGFKKVGLTVRPLL